MDIMDIMDWISWIRVLRTEEMDVWTLVELSWTWGVAIYY